MNYFDYHQFLEVKRLAARLSMVVILACTAYGQEAEAPKVPYDLQKFKEVLSQCRLQSPSTSEPLVRDGQFEGFSKPGRFYLAEDGSTMVLGTTEDGRDRSELRHNSHFSVAGKQARLTASLRFDKPASTGAKARLHIMQIHIKDFLGNDNGPLLMLSWREGTGDKPDNIWAKVRQDFVPKNKKNKLYDLGPRPDKFTTLDVRVEEGILRISVNGKMLVEDDVSEFAEAQCYFKTGCYTSKLKAHAVEFESLSISTPKSGPEKTASTTAE
jgi:hypothetical protein